MAIINGTPQNDNNTGASFGGFLGLVLQTKNFRPALIGTLGDDEISGLAGTDILVGLSGNDLLDGGTEADTMFGGLGDDTYIVDNTADIVGEAVIEGAGGGTDLVKSSVTYSLNGSSFSLPGISGVANNAAAPLPIVGLGLNYLPYQALTLLTLTPTLIENLTLTGLDNIDGTGNALDNVITGNKGNNQLWGLGGDDTFVASAGDDTIDGGDDYDIADYGSIAESITLNGSGDLTLTVEKAVSGTDTLLNVEEVIADDTASNNTIDFSGADPGITVDVDLSVGTITTTNVTDLTFSLAKVINFDDVIGTNGNDNILGDSQDNILKGGKGTDNIVGGAGNDLISGGADKDILTGGGDNDFFDYNTLTDSKLGLSWFNVNLSKVDVITDFTVGEDKFLVQSAPTNNGFFSPAVRYLSVNSVFGLGATVLGLATLGAYDAAQITVGSGLGARTFVAINNGSFGFNANTDAFIELTNFTGQQITVNDFATTV